MNRHVSLLLEIFAIFICYLGRTCCPHLIQVPQFSRNFLKWPYSFPCSYIVSSLLRVISSSPEEMRFGSSRDDFNGLDYAVFRFRGSGSGSGSGSGGSPSAWLSRVTLRPTEPTGDCPRYTISEQKDSATDTSTLTEPNSTFTNCSPPLCHIIQNI